MFASKFHCIALFAIVLIAVLPRLAIAADDADSQRALYQQMVARAIGYVEAAQADDGSFSSHNGPGITAVVLTGLLKQGKTVDDPTVAKALDYLLKHIKRDGGVYQEGSTHENYETCLVILCLKEANKNGRYNETLKNAEKYIKEIQWDEGEDQEPSDLSYGGSGYGSHKRPDLSNTSFFLDALKELGDGPDDPAVQKALIFVSRCQNLESPDNATQFATMVGDGGFYYTIAAGGSSQAGETPEGGLRSYGSMTYAGLKSMIFAGVGPEDPRVKAAYEWVRKHYTLEENPGMGSSGLFYYYHTFAKALDAVGHDVIIDEGGKNHIWRSELVEKLSDMQKPDGSWVNSNARWLEGDPNLVTGYCLMALSYCEPE
jgi:squalene-hopene/tetraprenyl-beta-curcumene cyclase